MRHIPVLQKETIDLLNLKSGDRVVDCTLGDAGHSEMILEKISPNGMLLGIDLDAEAILRAKRFLYRYGEAVLVARGNFADIQQIVTKNDFHPVNAVLVDLGWSTPQFEERNRGFSFTKDEPLDMRFYADPSGGMTAADVLNTYPKEDLLKIFKNYGEEKLSVEIADEIVRIRKEKPFSTTLQLTELVLGVYRKKLKTDKEIPWVGGIHPATKIYQALRIEVNNELGTLKNALPAMVEVVEKGGRVAIITFHSLEDRIVKQYFKSIENKKIKLINKKPVIAGEEEIINNPRSRSAKLRVVEKL